MELNKLTLAATAVVLFLGHRLTRAMYNLCFHKLAGFPGPWWAAISHLAEFYYDVVQGGLYYRKIVEMHEAYGPIVRINPDELHINDPYFYEQVYAGNTQKRNRDKNNARIAGTRSALNTTIEHDLHRQRRGYIAGFFSKKSIFALEPYIQGKVDRLVEKLKEAHCNHETLIGVQVFGALTTDIITHYAYGDSFEELEKPGFPCPLQRDVKALLLSTHFRRFLPAITNAIELLPEWLLKRINPAVASFLDLQHLMEQYSVKALNKAHTEGEPAKTATMLDALTAPNIPAHDKTVQRLKDENQLILSAGLDTTSRALTAMVCFLATYPRVLTKLRNELTQAVNRLGAKPTWSQLEALPYTTAVINESLRCHCFMTSRFPRVPADPLPYKEWLIPAGTTVGAMPWLLNRHPDIFPDPDAFRPERWLEADARGERLDRFLVTFSKGTRMCLGINLAYAELYLTVAALVLNFDLELVDSSIENIVLYRDYALSFDKEYNFGVDFRIAKVLHE